MVIMGNAMRKSILVAFLTALVVCFTVAGAQFFSTVKAATEVSGIIASDTVWTKSNSPYNLTGNVLVESGVTLTVEADTTVNFDEYYIRVNGSLIIQPGVTLNIKTVVGSGSIQVNGLLTARGTSTNPIHVNGGTYYYAWIAPPTYSSIVFSQYSVPWSEQTGSGCIIENAILSSTNINVNNSPKITKNTFIDNSGVTVSSGSPEISKNAINGRIAINGGSPTISSNNIKNGQIFYYSDHGGDYVTIIDNVISHAMGQSSSAAIWFLGGSFGGHVLIERNLITNSAVGIEIFNPNTEDLKTSLTIQKNTIINNIIGISIRDPCAPTIIDNNIYNNSTNIELSLQASNDIDATYNWWGTTDKATISQKIYDFDDDFNLGKVTFIPFLNEPNSEAPEATYVPTSTPPPTDSPTPTPTTTPTPTPPQEPQQTDQTEAIVGVAIAVAVIGAGLGLLIYLIKRK
jgi:hypothetical protein